MAALLPLILFRMGLFGAAHGWDGEAKRSPISKISQTDATLMKFDTVMPYLKKIQKIYKWHDTPLELEFYWH